jgi:exosortase
LELIQLISMGLSPLVLRGACLGTALVATLPALVLLRTIWQSSEYLGHGYFIPAAAGLLVHANRARVAEALRSGAPPGAGALWVLAAALLQSAVVAAQVTSAAALGMAALLAATAYAVAGRRLLGPLLPGLAFLLLMAPPPIFMRDQVLVGLKAAVVQSSVRALQALEYPVTAIGSRVLLPGHELFVADACSGLNSVVTLLPLAVIVAHFASRGVWRRLLIVASTVPLAVFGNAVRVIATVVLVHSYGGSFAEGWLHETFGLVTAGAGTLALLGIAKVLR